MLSNNTPAKIFLSGSLFYLKLKEFIFTAKLLSRIQINYATESVILVGKWVASQGGTS